MYPVSNLIPPQLSSNYPQTSGGDFPSSVPYANISGTSQAFNASSSGFRMDGGIHAPDDGISTVEKKPVNDGTSILGVGALKISRGIEQKAIADILFQGAKDEDKLRQYYKESSLGKKCCLRDLSVGISVLRQIGGDPAKCAEFTQKFREYVVKDRKNEIGRQASAFYGWTPKNEKIFKKILQLRVDIEREVTKTGVDPFEHQKDNVSTPAVIEYLENIIGELSDHSRQQIKAADGLLSNAAWQMVDRLNTEYKEWREDGIRDQPFDAYIKQIYLALSMPELSRQLTPARKKTPESAPEGSDSKKKTVNDEPKIFVNEEPKKQSHVPGDANFPNITVSPIIGAPVVYVEAPIVHVHLNDEFLLNLNQKKRSDSRPHFDFTYSNRPSSFLSRTTETQENIDGEEDDSTLRTSMSSTRTFGAQSDSTRTVGTQSDSTRTVGAQTDLIQAHGTQNGSTQTFEIQADIEDDVASSLMSELPSSNENFGGVSGEMLFRSSSDAIDRSEYFGSDSSEEIKFFGPDEVKFIEPKKRQYAELKSSKVIHSGAQLVQPIQINEFLPIEEGGFEKGRVRKLVAEADARERAKNMSASEPSANTVMPDDGSKSVIKKWPKVEPAVRMSNSEWPKLIEPGFYRSIK